jgi:hypothetical protein
MGTALETIQPAAPTGQRCSECGLVGSEQHDCRLVLLERARWLILHYAHSFSAADKLEAQALVEQSALVLARAGDGI